MIMTANGQTKKDRTFAKSDRQDTEKTKSRARGSKGEMMGDRKEGGEIRIDVSA